MPARSTGACSRRAPGRRRYRFVSNAASSVGQTITVHDTCTDSTAVHDLLPAVITPIVDDDIFPIACATHLFANDFESGNVGFWSVSTLLVGLDPLSRIERCQTAPKAATR